MRCWSTHRSCSVSISGGGAEPVDIRAEVGVDFSASWQNDDATADIENDIICTPTIDEGSQDITGYTFTGSMTLSNIRNASFPTNGLRNVTQLSVSLHPPQAAGFPHSFEVQSGVASNTKIGGITDHWGAVTASRYPTCEVYGASNALIIRLWNSSSNLIEIADDSVWSFTITDPVVVTFRPI